jgi:DNA polymerase III alpha subunit
MELTHFFRRPVPDSPTYRERLARELSLIKRFGFAESFAQIREILDLAKGFRHITRGSAGCSLVAYLMGIHNMDPVANGFVLSRFMHEARPDLPDIDVDFGHNDRDEVLRRVMGRYRGRVARISNHVRYGEGSAIRQALREAGFRGFLPRGFRLEDVAGDRSEEILHRSRAIVGSLKNYSLHCGGIVIFPDAVPEELKIAESQISLNKDEVEERGLFKIDLLCNRGISQLDELSSRPLEDYPEHDERASRLFRSGDTWGVTFAESPAQRKLHRELSPSSRSDVIFSLALIRPFPSADGRKHEAISDFHARCDGSLVYDDDAILMIQRAVCCSESEAEVFRKAFAKQNQEAIRRFSDLLGSHPDRRAILRQLGYLKLYSFCRAHAMSYGNLVWALAYEKARSPRRFWAAALNHAQTMYRPWVHHQQAKASGLRFASFGRGPWRLDGDWLVPSREDSSEDGWSQYASRGYWISNRFMPGMYAHHSRGRCRFRGLIAAGRHHTAGSREFTFVTVGVDTGIFLDVILDGIHEFEQSEILEGEGSESGHAINCFSFRFESVQRPQRSLFDAQGFTK